MPRIVHFEIQASEPVHILPVYEDVPDLDGCLGRIDELPGTLALPKAVAPGIGWLARVADPDGTIVGLTQSDPAAA